MSDADRVSRQLDDVARTLLTLLDARYDDLSEVQRTKIRKIATAALSRAVKLRQLQQKFPSIDWFEKTSRFLGAAANLILDLAVDEQHDENG